jgi:hypothetical protein
LECVFCPVDLGQQFAMTFRGKAICTACFIGLSEAIHEREEEAEDEDISCCSECGLPIEFPQKSYVHNKKMYCYGCYGRIINESTRRQDRYACAGCNQTFFTQEPQWFEGKRYCSTCFQRMQQARQKDYEHLFWENIRESQRRTYDYNFGGYSYYGFGSQRTSGTSANASYISQEVVNAFKVLGLKPEADTKAIKKAFKALALQKHPDLGGNHADMVTLNKAKETALEYARNK